MKIYIRIFIALIMMVFVSYPVFSQDQPEKSTQEEELPDEIEIFGPGSEDDSTPPEGKFEKGPEVPQGSLQGVTSEVYMIVNGDNLWAICQQFIGNPYEWPKLWSYNQYITNPHYIFPGDQIVFQPGSETRIPKMSVEKPGEPVEEIPVDDDMIVEDEKGTKDNEPLRIKKDKDEMMITLRNLSFVSKEEIESAGEITHSGQAKRMLAAGDDVYLKFKKGRKRSVKVGDRFVVFETIGKVRDPKKGRFLGYQIFKKANVRINEIKKDVYVGKILDSEYDIRRDDRVIPYSDPVVKVKPKFLDKDLTGYISGTENKHRLIASNDFAFVNLGIDNGVDPGTVLYIVRRGDGLGIGDDRKLPWTVVGKVVVVETRQKASTVWVMDSTKSLEVGDIVKTKL